MKALALALVAACAAPSARVAAPPSPAEPVATEPVASSEPAPRAHALVPLPTRLAAPRPPLDLTRWVPDVEAEARWPLRLDEHPSADPSFDVAGALAAPGVSWRELCARGAARRHLAKDPDLVAYLGAWCTADPADALYQLGLLRHSATRGIADAIALDTARIVVGNVSADAVEGLLRRAHLLDAATVDLIAASYLEVGKLDDALAMNRLAADADHEHRDDVACRRLVRAIAASGGDAREAFAEQLHEMATPRAVPRGLKALPRDPTCVALDRDVMCWTAPSETCVPAPDSATKALLTVYASWPRGEAGFTDWELVVREARAALPRPEAFVLLERAAQLAIATSGCAKANLGGLELELALATADERITALLRRVQHLADLAIPDCVDAVRGSAI